MAQALGYRGQQVLDFIAAHKGRRPPSYAAIADALGMSSTADVCNVVRRLEKRGYVRRCDTGTRHRMGWHEPVLIVVELTQTT